MPENTCSNCGKKIGLSVYDPETWLHYGIADPAKVRANEHCKNEPKYPEESLEEITGIQSEPEKPEELGEEKWGDSIFFTAELGKRKDDVQAGFYDFNIRLLESWGLETRISYGKLQVRGKFGNVTDKILALEDKADHYINACLEQEGKTVKAMECTEKAEGELAALVEKEGSPVYECEICEEEFTNNEGVICQRCNTDDSRQKRYEQLFESTEKAWAELKETQEALDDPEFSHDNRSCACRTNMETGEVIVECGEHGQQRLKLKQAVVEILDLVRAAYLPRHIFLRKGAFDPKPQGICIFCWSEQSSTHGWKDPEGQKYHKPDCPLSNLPGAKNQKAVEMIDRWGEEDRKALQAENERLRDQAESTRDDVLEIISRHKLNNFETDVWGHVFDYFKQDDNAALAGEESG